jgi:hypothetical protein
MKTENIERFLEILEDTCFPIQIDWNNKELYIKGIEEALKKIELEIETEGEAFLLGSPQSAAPDPDMKLF